MSASPWHFEILRASSPEEVLATVHDYLVLWRPDELAQLPEPLDGARLVQPQDVADYAAALLGHESESGRRASAREALTAFFAVAARRLAELAAGPGPEVEQAGDRTEATV